MPVKRIIKCEMHLLLQNNPLLNSFTALKFIRMTENVNDFTQSERLNKILKREASSKSQD